MKVFLEISLDQKILILVAIRSDIGDYRKINEFTKDNKLNEFTKDNKLNEFKN